MFALPQETKIRKPRLFSAFHGHLSGPRLIINCRAIGSLMPLSDQVTRELDEAFFE